MKTLKKIQNHRTIYNQIYRQINWKEILDFVISWNEKTLLSFEHLLLVPQIESQLALVLCEGNSYKKKKEFQPSPRGDNQIAKIPRPLKSLSL